MLQAYVICELQEKVNVLWSFIKSHLRSKVIVFLSTCKQVKFMYEAFKKLRPGVPLRSLHGKMKQFKRMAVFYDFCEVSHRPCNVHHMLACSSHHRSHLEQCKHPARLL